jgi:TfoX/Sxy family transcriptional regulator of competence genes
MPLLDRMRALVGDLDGVHEKGIVGGQGFMRHGNLVCGVVSGDLVVRVGKPGFANAVAQPGARPMTMAGRASSTWVAVDAARVADDAALRDWVGRGLDFVATLPRK